MNLLFFLTPKQDVTFVYDHWTVRQALEKMEKTRYSSVPVLDKDGIYVGTLTEGDLLWGTFDRHLAEGLTPEDIPLKSIPRRKDYAAIPAVGTDMDTLLSMAADQNFVPVVDGRNNFIGIVRRQQILEYFLNRYRAEQHLND